MENWREYLLHAKSEDIYGSLYLFEDNNVSELSFYDKVSRLSESNDDVASFLQDWEQSINYMFDNLNEQTEASAIDDAVIKASTQAYLALGKLKDKAVGPVVNVMNKLKAFEKQNPKTAKVIKFTLKGLAVAVALAASSQAMAAGGGPDEIQAVADILSSVDPEIADSMSQITPETVESHGGWMKQKLGQIVDTMGQSDDAGMQQIAQAAEGAEQALDIDSNTAAGVADTSSPAGNEQVAQQLTKMGFEGNFAVDNNGPGGNRLYTFTLEGDDVSPNLTKKALARHIASVEGGSPNDYGIGIEWSQHKGEDGNVTRVVAKWSQAHSDAAQQAGSQAGGVDVGTQAANVSRGYRSSGGDY